jgi:hypothetical protein
VQVRVGPHGKLLGDRLRTYLVLGSGAGEPIDELVAVGPTVAGWSSGATAT